MKAQELRIGNFVHYKDFDKHDIVIELSEESVLIENIISIDSEGVFRGAYGDIKPIPLTEDWLVKFGFVRLGNQDTWFGRALWSKGKFAVMHGYGTTNGQRTKYDLTEFDYVHQLQNLYFALTGEELTVNEKSPTI